MTACIIVPECKIKVLKHSKFYKDAYILQESFAMADKSYPPPCRNFNTTVLLIRDALRVCPDELKISSNELQISLNI